MIYVNQPKPLGMADAVGRCEKLSRGSPIIVVTGDNLYGGDFKKEISSFTKGAVVFLRKVKHPERFGVPIYDTHKKLVRIEEKPRKPTGNWVITAPYLFDSQVFDLIKKLSFSARGELEMADLISLYIELGLLKLIKRKDFWLDVGTFETLLKANQHIHTKNTCRSFNA